MRLQAQLPPQSLPTPSSVLLLSRARPCGIGILALAVVAISAVAVEINPVVTRRMFIGSRRMGSVTLVSNLFQQG
jgi:hypothetical protein